MNYLLLAYWTTQDLADLTHCRTFVKRDIYGHHMCACVCVCVQVSANKAWFYLATISALLSGAMEYVMLLSPSIQMYYKET